MPTWVYSPFLFVFVSYFRVTPPWYSMVTMASAMGWPLSSMIFPRAVPVWARAADPARARARNSPPVTNKRLIAWSSRGALRPRNLSILSRRAHEDRPGTEGLSPRRGRRKKMRVAERHVRGRDHARHRRPFAHGHGGIREAAPPDRAQVGEVHDQRALGTEMLGEPAEAFQLLRLGALAVVGVEEGQPVLGGRDGGGEAGVHPAADADDGQRLHTPRSTPGQRYLWSLTCRRAGIPSSRFQRASSPGSTTPCTGENSTGQRSKSFFSRARFRDHS